MPHFWSNSFKEYHPLMKGALINSHYEWGLGWRQWYSHSLKLFTVWTHLDNFERFCSLFNANLGKENIVQSFISHIVLSSTL